MAAGTIPTSAQVLGPVTDAAAICRAGSVQSVSPAPLGPGSQLPEAPMAALLPATAAVAGMIALDHHYRKQRHEEAAVAGELAET